MISSVRSKVNNTGRLGPCLSLLLFKSATAINLLPITIVLFPLAISGYMT